MAHRHPGEVERLALAARQVVGSEQLGLDWGWHDRVDGDPRRGELERTGAREADERRLRGRLGRALDAAEDDQAGDVDHPAPVALAHSRQDRLRGLNRRVDVDTRDLFQRGDLDRSEPLWSYQANIVDHAVEGEASGQIGDDCIGCRIVGKAGCHERSRKPLRSLRARPTTWW